MSGGDSIDGGPLEICNSEGVFSVYFWPGLVIVGMSLSQSLSLSMTRHKTNKEKILQAPSPLSLRHQARDITLLL